LVPHAALYVPVTPGLTIVSVGGEERPLRPAPKSILSLRLLLQTKAWIEGLIFNGSQHWSCSATYETLTQNQVVYDGFSTRFFTNMRCSVRRGAALFRPHPDPVTNGSSHRDPRAPATPDQPTHLGAWVSLRLGGILTERRSVIIPQMVASHQWLLSQAHEPNVCTCGSSRTEQDYHCNNTSSVG